MAVPLYKFTEEPEEAGGYHAEVEKVKNKYGLNHWMSVFEEHGFVLKMQKHFKFKNVTPKQMAGYMDHIMKTSQLTDVDESLKEEYRRKFQEYVEVISDNMTGMMYSLLMYTKESCNAEPELFMGEEINIEP